ncbi:MAG: acetate kinase [Clostridia bacterium]|nr:acetate kinase [Clostridia bacterium]MBQ3927144.1 acetate kinase [Clostridia bacterium]
MKILVVNAGSSSLKYQLFDMDKNTVIAKGLCEKIGIGGAITHKRPGKADYHEDIELKDHDDAIALVLKLLTDPELGVISSVDEIDAVGHRVAHGGKLKASMIVTDEVLHYLESIVGINPLHGPPAIKGINACKKVMPGKPMVTVFDTSFHSTMPEKSYIYALPYEYYEKYQVRRYGFHGTSHRYVAREAAKFVGKPMEELKIITCHCGNGSSFTAVKNGKVIDTSMGFTPQEGLPMGTRCGSIDPTIVTYLMKQEGLTPDQMDDVLNKKSGLLGVSGVSSDMREVWAAADAGNERAKLALDILIQDAKKIIGSYIAEMGGIDVLLFTAGIGENDRAFRAGVCKDMEYLGIKIDEAYNASCPRGENVELTAPGAKVRTLVIPTDEELMIATDTLNLIK